MSKRMTTADFLWQMVVILAAGGGAACLCRVHARSLSPVTFPALIRKAPHLYLALLLLVALPGVNVYVSIHPSLQWDMPVWLQYHWAALSWGIISGTLACVFGFCSMAARLMDLSWKWGTVVFGLVTLMVIQFYAGWMSRPNLPPLGETRISPDGVILQTSPFTCVPAAGANIAEILGIHTTERELAKLFHTTRDGTFPAQALRGMEKLGIAGDKVASGTLIGAVKPPAMLFISGDTHAVVYAGMKNGLLDVWNPNSGKALIPEWWLLRMWDGHALEFSREVENN